VVEIRIQTGAITLQYCPIDLQVSLFLPYRCSDYNLREETISQKVKWYKWGDGIEMNGSTSQRKKNQMEEDVQRNRGRGRAVATQQRKRRIRRN
jgi:hypothetical protein